MVIIETTNAPVLEARRLARGRWQVRVLSELLSGEWISDPLLLVKSAPSYNYSFDSLLARLCNAGYVFETKSGFHHDKMVTYYRMAFED